MSKKENELSIINIELKGGTVQLKLPIKDKDSLLKILSNPDFKGELLDSKSIIVPSKEDDLNDYQVAWADFKSVPSIISMFFTLDINKLWKIINSNYTINADYANKKAEIYLDSEDESLVENSRYFLKLDIGLYITFIDLGVYDKSSTTNNLVFTYDSSIYDHEELLDHLIKILTPAIIVEDIVEDDNKILIANYTDEGFIFEPYDIDKVVIGLKGNKKKVYNEIVDKINTNDKGLYILSGVRESGKLEYIKKLIKNINKKIIYVPISSFEFAFADKFFKSINSFGDIVVIFEDCEIYLKGIGTSNIYSSILLGLSNTLSNREYKFNCILVLNIENINELYSDLVGSNRINYISMHDEQIDFKGY